MSVSLYSSARFWLWRQRFAAILAWVFHITLDNVSTGDKLSKLDAFALLEIAFHMQFLTFESVSRLATYSLLLLSVVLSSVLSFFFHNNNDTSIGEKILQPPSLPTGFFILWDVFMAHVTLWSMINSAPKYSVFSMPISLALRCLFYISC